MINKITLFSLVLFTSIINSAPPELPFDPDKVAKIGSALQKHLEMLDDGAAQEFTLQPLNHTYVGQFSRSDAQNPRNNSISTHIDKAPEEFNFNSFSIDLASRTTDQNKVSGYARMTPLSFAILTGNKDLTSLFLGKLTPEQLNGKEARVWGYRQPFTPAHLAVDPQYPFPLACNKSSVWEENVINLVRHDADLNFRTNRYPESCYDNPPLLQVYADAIHHGDENYLEETGNKNYGAKFDMQALLVLLGAEPVRGTVSSMGVRRFFHGHEDINGFDATERKKAVLRMYEKLYADENTRGLIKPDSVKRDTDYETKEPTGNTMAGEVLALFKAEKKAEIDAAVAAIANKYADQITHMQTLLPSADGGGAAAAAED